MARRPVFLPVRAGKPPWVREIPVEFTWYPGFSRSQKQRSVASLHEAARRTLGLSHILEVSSKSTEELGVALSAFRLRLGVREAGTDVPVECAFQAGKVLRGGRRFPEVLRWKPRLARRYLGEKVKELGGLEAFELDGTTWPLTPPTLFYDWLYLSALARHRSRWESILEYEAFTDIEFNPARSINCQARSVALFVALVREGVLQDALSSPDQFKRIVSGEPGWSGGTAEERPRTP